MPTTVYSIVENRVSHLTPALAVQLRSDSRTPYISWAPCQFVRVIDDPIQMIVSGPASTGIVIFTFTVSVDVLVHPLTSVPVTVYTVVTAGDAVTTAPVVVERPGAAESKRM